MSDYTPESFSWGKLILDMRLKGLAAMIACHTEPVIYDANGPKLTLEVNKTLEELKDSPGFTRMIQAIQDHFGENMHIVIGFGPAKRSPAAIAYEKRVNRYAQAYSTIAEDDFISRIIEEFGGKVIVESVRPLKRNTP
jgi:DNA polymerase-3 subunit gamma/tau